MKNLPENNSFPNLLMIAGTGQNSGKTSFICNICEQWDLYQPLICIKISNHFDLQPGSRCLYANSKFSIYEETKPSDHKDTQRMLKAGASRVFFIKSDRENVNDAFLKILEIIPTNAAIICESGSLRRYIKPSVFILLHTIGFKPKDSTKDLMEVADKIFQFENGNLQIPNKPVVFTQHQWKLNLA